MHSTPIPYHQTGFFSNTALDYIDRADSLRPFYRYEPGMETFDQVLEDMKVNSWSRETLVGALNDQYGDFDLHPAVEGNIESLNKENTFTVTTAHQLNLFTGPLYYIYKILNVIRLSEDLNARYPDHHFVPCYWMGSEDHDFEEINHTYLFNKRIQWTNEQGGAVGTYSTAGITDLIPEVRQIIRQGNHLDTLMNIMQDAYEEPHMSQAVRKLLHHLFASYGLVVVDGSTRSLKQPFSAIIIDELTNQSSSTIVNEQIGRMESRGYKAQANPRPINLFYNAGRQRERIVPDGEDFKLADSGEAFKRSQFLDIASNYPERFSPNVILRPVHQQCIMPNVAYIGGGSEVAYWLQLHTLFLHHGVHFPMLLQRTSAQIIAKFQAKKLDKYGLPLEQIFENADSWKRDYANQQQDVNLELKDEQTGVQSLFDKLKTKATAVDPSLDKWIGAEEQKVLNALDNISKRLIKAEKDKHDVAMNGMDNLKENLFPEGQLQERRENFMAFYAQEGPSWLADLKEELDPLDFRFKILHQ